MIDFNNSYIYVLFLILIVFFIFYKYPFKIGEKINILDKNKVPLIGGIFLFIGFLLNYLFLDQDRISFYKIDIYFISLIFFIALIDDKFNLSATSRILTLSIVIIYFVNTNDFFINTYFKIIYKGF